MQQPKAGDKVCVKGYENLPLDVVFVSPDKHLERRIFLRHPISREVMAYARGELAEHRPTSSARR